MVKGSIPKVVDLVKKKKVVIVTLNSDKYRQDNEKIVKSLSKKGLAGVYVTLNVPSNSLQNIHSKGAALCFVDAISKMAGEKEMKNCFYVEDPTSLTSLSVTLSDILTSKQKVDYVYFDSVSALLIYNNVDTSARFLHHLMNKFRSHGIGGIFIAPDDVKTRQIISLISQFSDVNLKI